MSDDALMRVSNVLHADNPALQLSSKSHLHFTLASAHLSIHIAVLYVTDARMVFNSLIDPGKDWTRS